MKKTSIIFILCCLSTVVVTAQQSFTPKINTVATTPTGKQYNEVIKPSTVSKPGLFTIHKNDDKYFFEIPDTILGRELLLTNWLVKVPGGSPKYGGEILGNQTLSFEKGNGNKLFLRLITLVNAVDSNSNIAKAVKNDNVDPIAMVFDIKARGLDDKSSIIDVTDFFQKENSFSTVGDLKGDLGLMGLAADRSYIKSMNAYPINVEIKTVRTYSASGMPTKAPNGASIPPTEAAKEAGAVTVEMSTSIMLMPKVPMQPRYFDPRVGYFAENYKVYSDDQQRVDDNTFIIRYRLEPKAEDMEKYKRGELVEPKQQIVYYVDPATPKQWRKYVIAGINDWNAAFEKAGFKNAIVGKEWPENDSTMSLEDMRYKVVRYLPSDIANAYGPNIHDPRSGEVLQSYVGWYHNIMQLLHDWYFIQASAIDTNARKMKFSDELMGSLIRFAVSHEIGHTLGLRHNMGSSSQTPVEKLRDKKWVEEHGHTASIMDYARFNYVAQPGDGITEKGIMPRIGDYDKWAIEWGYRYIGAKTEEDDKKIEAKLIVDSLKANPRLWFGGEGRNFDARCQTEDLGDNSMKASEYGIKNLKLVMAHLPEWTKEDNDTYTNLLNMYKQVVSQFNRYCSHVAKNVGSIYENVKSVEQDGDVYTPAPKAIQKEAVAFLNKQVFDTPKWLLDENILNKLSSPVRMGSVGTIHDRMIDLIFDDRVFNTMLVNEHRNGREGSYCIDEFITDVKSGVWKELNTHEAIDIYRRELQKKYVAKLFAAIKEAEFSTHMMAAFFGATGEELLPITSNSEIPSYLSYHLENLRQEILKAIPLAKDKDTKAHLEYMAATIKQGLENRFKKPEIRVR
jgi:hypothetical protein